MSIKFYLRDAKAKATSIYAIVFFKGQTYKIHTGQSINPKQWSRSRQRQKPDPTTRDAELLNDALDFIADRITTFLRGHKPGEALPTTEDIKACLSQNLSKDKAVLPSVTEWADNWVKTSDKRPRTITSYKTCINKLKAYENEKGNKLHFADVDITFYRVFKAWCNEQKLSRNYFGTLIKNIKVIMEESLSVHKTLGHRDRHFSVESERVVNVYLSEQELVSIHRLDLSESLILSQNEKMRPSDARRQLKSLVEARDKFLLGAFTALRFSDYNLLQYIDPGAKYIDIVTTKTNQRVVIPVHWVITEILQRRGGHLPQRVSNQKLNKALKTLGELAGLKQVIETSYTQGGKRKVERFLKYECITTHTARRSAATNMYLSGIDTLAIMQITGHKTERAFLLYIGVTPEENARKLLTHKFFQGENPGIKLSTG